ncbi:hypothetical protein TrVFT333_010665 [Trichoderma virens FT-333]|nr:hypothetical protein TrVFT333_010665 [Trichoderma virens FT-333]
MDALSVGSSDAESDGETAFVAETLFRTSYLPMGLAVEYEGQERQTIGWYNEEHMNWFDIDGAAGERLVRVGIGMNELPKRLEFVTSHDRHSQQYGDPQSNWTDWQQAEEGECLVGIAASFGYPCGYYPSASESEDMYPKSYVGSTSINALVMKLPLVKGNENNF